MNPLNTPIRKTEPSRALSAATDEVKVAGGNATDINVHVTNADALATEATLAQLKTSTDAVAKDSTAQALLAALTGTLNVQEASAAKEATLQALLAALTGTLTVSEPSVAKEATLQNLLKATQNVGSTVWTDDSGSFYIQRQKVDSDTDALTITYTDGAGNPVTPGAGLKPATAGSETLITSQSMWTATATSAEYTSGDTLMQVLALDASTSPATLVVSAWVNINTGNTLTSAPPTSDRQAQSNTVSVSNEALQVQPLNGQWPLPTGAAKEAGGHLESIDAKADDFAKELTVRNLRDTLNDVRDIAMLSSASLTAIKDKTNKDLATETGNLSNIASDVLALYNVANQNLAKDQSLVDIWTQVSTLRSVAETGLAKEEGNIRTMAKGIGLQNDVWAGTGNASVIGLLRSIYTIVEKKRFTITGTPEYAVGPKTITIAAGAVSIAIENPSKIDCAIQGASATAAGVIKAGQAVSMTVPTDGRLEVYTVTLPAGCEISLLVQRAVLAP